MIDDVFNPAVNPEPAQNNGNIVTNFPGFDILNGWRFLQQQVQVSNLGEQVVFCKAPLNGEGCEERFFEAGESIAKVLDQKSRAVLITPIIKDNELHMIALGFDAPSGNLLFMDSTGSRLQRDGVENLKVVVDGAKLVGKCSLTTQIDTQQGPEQPKTCVLWALRNSSDFVQSQDLAKPETPYEAFNAIESLVIKGIEFNRLSDNSRIMAYTG